MAGSNASVARAVLVFALTGLLVLVVIGVGGVLVLRRLGTTEAKQEAENLAAVSAEGIVQPRLTGGLFRGRAESRAAVDDIVQGAVLRDPIVGVRIWTPGGVVLYSSDLEGIGAELPLSDIATRAIESGGLASGEIDVTEGGEAQGDEPRFSVFVPVATPEGRQLLFETTLLLSSVERTGLEVWTEFLPVLAVALVAFGAVQIPLAWRLARQVRESQRDREQLLQRAIDASDTERRRITSDLHDGLVQEFAGLSMQLSARADKVEGSDPEGAEVLREGAALTRQGMRSLRSAVMGIYPPDVQRAGLVAALSDLTAPLEGGGVHVELEVPDGLALRPEIESLMFRCAQESVRNIVSHAGAGNVSIVVSEVGKDVRLEITDDGVGFDQASRARARAEGHMGLSLLDDMVRDASGRLEVTSAPGEGTRVVMEVRR